MFLVILAKSFRTWKKFIPQLITRIVVNIFLTLEGASYLCVCLFYFPLLLLQHTETFHKEVVMTSHQASMQNQRLPKGFVYVPIDRLSKEKPVVHDSKSHEPEKPGG